MNAATIGERIVRHQLAIATAGDFWIHPEKILRSWQRRNDERLDLAWREYHRGVARLGVSILRERRAAR